MFIFTMFFSLLMLPFTLLRMAFGLLGISTHLLLFPLKIVARHTVLCIVIAVALILYFAIKSDPKSLDTLKPAPPSQKQSQNYDKNAPPVIEPVRVQENGDSAFATDVYAIMNDQERAYYSSVFYKVMQATPDGQSGDWAFYNINGTLRPTATFKNNVGGTCRRFTEVLKVHHVQQTITGIACAKGDGSWCKLKSTATPSCGLGHSPGAFDGLGNAIKNLF
jgi:surface antigen